MALKIVKLKLAQAMNDKVALNITSLCQRNRSQFYFTQHSVSHLLLHLLFQGSTATKETEQAHLQLVGNRIWEQRGGLWSSCPNAMGKMKAVQMAMCRVVSCGPFLARSSARRVALSCFPKGDETCIRKSKRQSPNVTAQGSRKINRDTLTTRHWYTCRRHFRQYFPSALGFGSQIEE